MITFSEYVAATTNHHYPLRHQEMRKRERRKKNVIALLAVNVRKTHPDLVGSRVLVHLEDRVVIILSGRPVVVGFLLRSRFTSTHDN